MEQRDYLKIQIDQLGRVLGQMLSKLIGLKNDDQINVGIQATEEAFKEEFNLDLDELIAIPDHELIDTLKQKHPFLEQQWDKLADIIFELAEGFYDKDQKDEAINLYRKTLIIYDHFHQKEATYSFERHDRIEKIKKIIYLK